MKYLATLPFYSLIDESPLDCGLWQSKKNVCEMQDYNESDNDFCDKSDLYFGTTDSREPKFCGKHFFSNVVNGDGKTNYKLISEEEAKKYL